MLLQVVLRSCTKVASFCSRRSRQGTTRCNVDGKVVFMAISAMRMTYTVCTIKIKDSFRLSTASSVSVFYDVRDHRTILLMLVSVV